MNCPEAVEWMHRYLDHDLNEEESSLLFEHIRRCGDCAEAFELLNRLSKRLEDLPKVIPNFSLVDAILPQLDAIDRARREEGSKAEAAGLPMTALNGTGSGDIGPMLNSRGSRQRGNANSASRSRIYRYGSLGVAAALILGVFIYQYEPRTVSDAEIAMDSSLTETRSMDSSSAADSAEDASGSTPLLADGGSEGNTGSGGEPSEAEAPDAGEPSNGAPAEKTTPDNRAGTGSSRDTDSLPQEQNNPATPVPAGNVEAPAPKETGSANQTDDGTSAQDLASQEMGILGDAGSPEAPAEPDQPLLNREVTDGVEPRDDNFRYFAIMENPEVWTSPDGRFTAELKDGHLYIYQNELEDRKLVSDQWIDGNWINGVWSEESDVFTYETEKDGNTVSHKVDVDKAAAASTEEIQP